jgi:hypothetical protein
MFLSALFGCAVFLIFTTIFLKLDLFDFDVDSWNPFAVLFRSNALELIRFLDPDLFAA